MGVPNYVTTEEYKFAEGGVYKDLLVLPAGSHIKPLYTKYVPTHVLEDKRWRGFNEETEVYCYTKFGIFPLPKSIIREA